MDDGPFPWKLDRMDRHHRSWTTTWGIVVRDFRILLQNPWDGRYLYILLSFWIFGLLFFWDLWSQKRQKKTRILIQDIFLTGSPVAENGGKSQPFGWGNNYVNV